MGGINSVLVVEFQAFHKNRGGMILWPGQNMWLKTMRGGDDIIGKKQNMNTIDKWCSNRLRITYLAYLIKASNYK